MTCNCDYPRECRGARVNLSERGDRTINVTDLFSCRRVQTDIRAIAKRDEPKSPRCEDCRFYLLDEELRCCSHQLSLRKEPGGRTYRLWNPAAARYQGEHCGPEGKLWEAKT